MISVKYFKLKTILVSLVLSGSILFSIAQIIDLSEEQKIDIISKKCNYLDNPISISAYNRAKTNYCKSEIHKIACFSRAHETLLKTNRSANILYRSNLARKCPTTTINLDSRFESKYFINCLTKSDLYDYINKLNQSIASKTFLNVSFSIDDVSTFQMCIDICLAKYKYLAYNSLSKDCICLINADKDVIINRNACLNNYEIFETGNLDIEKISLDYKNQPFPQILNKFNSLKKLGKLPRIVFLFQLNGRSIRQVKRLIKTVYDDMHFYYILVDKRMNFLREEIKSLVKTVNKTNLRIAPWSLASSWGSSLHLNGYLKALNDLIHLKNSGNENWNWDFVVNLSESDFPIKSIQEFTLFLNQNRNKNFLSFAAADGNEYIKKHGLELLFFQCEERMWQINKRTLPTGIQFLGGSDWYVLNFNLANYLVNSNDELVIHLKLWANFSAASAETFVHTVVLNSEFCNDYIASDLKLAKWKTCECETDKFKHIDFCGCSPEYFTIEDLKPISYYRNKPIFFARKFNPVRSNGLINIIDEDIFGKYTDSKSLRSYWDNVYSIKDIFRTIKIESLIEFLHQISIAKLNVEISSIKNHLYFNLQDSNNLIDLFSSDQESRIQELNIFIEDDLFKGYVLKVNLNNRKFKEIKLEYEAFFRVDSNTIIFEKNEWGFFIRNIKEITLCNEFTSAYPKKLDKCTGSLVGQDDDPEFVIKFKRKFYLSFNLEIKWLNPYGVNTKTSNINVIDLKENCLNSTLFQRNENKFINETGLWTIEVKYLGENILIKKFLVIPDEKISHNQQLKEDWKKKFELFWKFESLCIESVENEEKNISYIHNKIFKHCSTSTHWSTFYPDPKSNMDLKAGLDYAKRNITEVCQNDLDHNS